MTDKVISVHVESLHHVDSIIVRVQLCSPRNEHTTLRLSEDGRSISLHHENQQVTVGLPKKLSSSTNLDKYLPESPGLHCTFKPELIGSISQNLTSDRSAVPWAANDLDSKVQVTCEACGTVVIHRGSIKDWRDLPSEGWAEMMDLWHCHKPDEHDHDNAGHGKGYASNSKLLAKPGVGLVDTIGFLLSEDICSNIKAGDTDDSVTCISCGAHIGQQVQHAEGIKLFKPLLAVSTSTSHSKSYDLRQWFAGQLIAAIESTGARRFYTNSVPLSIWVFMPNLTYASSDRDPQPTEGVKVLYQVVDPETHAGRDKLGGSKVHTEDLGLPSVLEQKLLNVLNESNEALPTPAASFMGWNTAYLPRFNT